MKVEAAVFAEARERGTAFVGTDLLLLGLSRGNSRVATLLSDLGASPDAISAVIALGDAGEVGPGAIHRARLSPRMERVIGVAEGLALANGRAVASTDFLVALLYERDGPHAYVLAQLGIDRFDLWKRLRADGVPVPTARPPADPEAKVFFDIPSHLTEIVLNGLTKRSLAGPPFTDASGEGRWGYGIAPDKDKTRIYAVVDLGIRELVDDILQEAEHPPLPPA